MSLRQKLKDLRRGLSPDAQSRATMGVRSTFLNWAQAKGETFEGKTLAFYRASHELGELDLEPLVDALREQGARAVFPRTVTSDLKQIEFAPVQGVSDFMPGPWKVLEPHAGIKAVALLEVDWFFVPGVGFTEHGERMGMGQGHYDRLLAQTRPDAVRVGCAHDIQIQTEILQFPHDQRMHWILTPTRMIAVSAATHSTQGSTP